MTNNKNIPDAELVGVPPLPREKTLHELNQEAAHNVSILRKQRDKTISIVLKIIRKREGDAVASRVEQYLPDLLAGKVVSTPRPKSLRAPVKV